jgi:hypothetical protein
MSECLTAEHLVSKYQANGLAIAQLGLVEVIVSELNGSKHSCAEVCCHWPHSSCGQQDTLATLEFASDLTEAARVALECERLLTEAGYTLYRKESPETEGR